MSQSKMIPVVAAGAALAAWACGGPSPSSPPPTSAVPVAAVPKTPPGASQTQPHGAAEPAAEPQPALEVVAELAQAPGNITVTPAGRIVMSLHQFYEPRQRVVTLDETGALQPFAAPARVDAVLGIQADRDGVVWMLDNGMRTTSRAAWSAGTRTRTGRSPTST